MILPVNSSVLSGNKLPRFFSICIALFLILFFGVILPSHHHTDGKEHPDCTLCQIQSQPAEAAVVFCLIFLVTAFLGVAVFNCQSKISEYSSAYHSRAPPLGQ